MFAELDAAPGEILVAAFLSDLTRASTLVDEPEPRRNL
jgi:hypothetical protein